MRVIHLSMAILAVLAVAEERTEHFDKDPGWDGMNNRSTIEMRPVIQDFGNTSNAPGGEIGGIITPDGHPAYYANAIPEVTMDSPLSASGTLTVKKGGGNVLFGFFNSKTVNEWRTPNTLVFRINGRGETFHAHTEYTSSKWRATAGVIGRYDIDADRMHPIENASDATYTWTIRYDPSGNDGAGTMSITLNDVMAVTDITPELRKDGATFDRFGLLTVVKHTDDPGEFYFHIDKVNGEPIDLSKDPMWDAVGNKAKFLSDETRPRFNFGYSETHFAGGEKTGEFGGLFFRGDCRYPEKLAYYGAKLEPLTLTKPLHASGKVVFKRGVSDSTTLFGFFHSEYSVRVHDSQKTGMPCDFAGFAIEGPSALGFYAYPCFRVHDGDSSSGYPENMPRIYPDGTPHTWKLEVNPASDGSVIMTFLLDETPPSTLKIPAEEVALGASFNRFGFVSPWIDGNGQHVYLDDITYTVKQ
ncbi:MAG: hypothetical protein IT367_15950 [Candidatus Hydrogenedentes bacterium]|nr:hypothetical protein [Candidatus Hydrogenedentota bacterium]